MSDEYDGPWKEAVEEDFALVLALFFPDVHAAIDWTRDHESLDQEFHKMLPEAEGGALRVDRLVRAARGDSDDPLYLHVEIQMSHDAEFGKRMYEYRTLIRNRYHAVPESLAVLGDDDPGWKPETYAEGQVRSEMGFRFGMVKVVEWAGRLADLKAGGSLFGLFVAAHLETLRTRKDGDARLRAKRDILRALLGRQLPVVEVHRWYRLIDWLMKVPRDVNLALWQELRQETEVTMSYVTAAEIFGQQQGWERGHAEGKIEGKIEGERDALLLSLSKVFQARFKGEAESLTGALAGADPGRLKALLDVALSAPLDEVRREIQATP